MSKKESKVTLTLQEAIDLKEDLTTECQAIGKEFRNTADKSLFSKLEAKNENLKRVTLAVLEANYKLENNENIKKLDIIKRLKEVIAGTIKNVQRDESILGKVKKFIGLKDSRYTEEELNELLLGYETTKSDITQFLGKFNTNNTIELNLINV